MKINPRLYPTIIVITFVLFLLIALVLGFRPGGHSTAATTTFILSLLGGGIL